MANSAAFQQFTLRGVRFTENEFGRGSYAVVLELEYQGLKCAGKKLYRILYEAGIGHAAHRYLEECRLLSQTRHPNIVQFLGVCFQEGSQFPILVMEFLPTNLTSCLQHYGILPDEISYSILHDVSLGLAYLHGQTPPIVHRDLSANNVLLSTNMTAKISDLGVAQILNLTPLQVSRMTETPGTPAYMPPEVMVADPHYDTSVDVFSFGVMMIHTFTAEWPLPKIGPTRIDSANPHRLIPVTEAERHEEFLRKISRENPLIDLIMCCLNSNPQLRPGAMELVSRMGGVVLEHPPSFVNRVEMLQQISSLLTEKREVVRKDLRIEEKVKEIEALSEEKRQQKEEYESTIEHMQLVYVVETDQLRIEIENTRDTVAAKDAELALRDSIIANKDSTITSIIVTKDSIIASKDASLQNKEATIKNLNEQLYKSRDTITAKNTEIALKDSIITDKDSMIALRDTIIASKASMITNKDSIISSKDTSLQNKEATIKKLNEQIDRARDYLSRKQQLLEVQLSCSQCSDAPVEMSSGQAVIINGKVYYGGGVSDNDDDKYRVHCYSPLQDQWTTLPSLHVNYFGLGEIKGELATVGGRNSHLPHPATDAVHVFAEGKKWKQSIPPMPTARYLPAVVSLPTHLVVAGGDTDIRVYTDIVEIYNINTSQWSKTDKLPYACKAQRGTLCNNTVYLIGGWDGNYLNKMVVASVDKLLSYSVPAGGEDDGSTDCESAWKEVAHVPSYRPSVVTVSDMVLAVSGWKDSSCSKPTQSIHVYSPSMDSWLYIDDLPSAVADCTTAPLSPTEWIMIGGRVEKNNRLPTTKEVQITVKI